MKPTPAVTIVYRPLFFPQRQVWFAWVAKDDDAHKPVWARRLSWWPVSEAQVNAWHDDVVTYQFHGRSSTGRWV